eukprot:2919076-Ditylum_brightwellii.AAC.1
MNVEDDWDEDVQWEEATDEAAAFNNVVLVRGPDNNILPQRAFTNVMAKGKGAPQKEMRYGRPNPMATSIGKLMEPWGIANSYPRTHRLSCWSQEEVEVDCGSRWSRAAVLAAVTRGPHTSALTPEAINL